MHYTALGRTGVQVSRLCLGTMLGRATLRWHVRPRSYPERGAPRQSQYTHRAYCCSPPW